MIETKKKDWEIFAEAMDNTPKKDYKDLRKQIMNVCGVEYYIITNWRNGRSRIPAEAKVKIEELFGTKIFEEKQS